MSDDWVLASQKAGSILPLPPVTGIPPGFEEVFPNDNHFLPHDPQREREWQFSIASASSVPRTDLLRGKKIYVTPALKREYGASGFSEIEDVARAVGAEEVRSRVWKRALSEADSGGNVIMLAREDCDPDAVELVARGWIAWHKDLLPMSVLRGELTTNTDEFKITPKAGVAAEDGAGRKVSGGSAGSGPGRGRKKRKS